MPIPSRVLNEPILQAAPPPRRSFCNKSIFLLFSSFVGIGFASLLICGPRALHGGQREPVINLASRKMQRVSRQATQAEVFRRPLLLSPMALHLMKPEKATAEELLLRSPGFTKSGGKAMVHYPQIISRALSANPKIAKMTADESQRNSKTWLEDLATSPVPGKEMTAGLFRMNAGKPLDYVYTYEEMKYIVDGEFLLTDGTGKKSCCQSG